MEQRMSGLKLRKMQVDKPKAAWNWVFPCVGRKTNERGAELVRIKNTTAELEWVWKPQLSASHLVVVGGLGNPLALAFFAIGASVGFCLSI